jgi:predicted transglutaminase-like cysteine proteinase
MNVKPVLNIIHKKTLNRFIYKTDEELWFMKEHWEAPDELPDEGPLIGDCDCFALSCRKQLRAKNIPNRLVLCGVYQGSKMIGHLVTEVQGWILDCRQTRVMANTELHYEWISMSGYHKNDPWFYINPDPKLWSKITTST